MNKTVIMIVVLGVAFGVYSFSKMGSEHIENYNIAVDHLKRDEFKEAIPYLEKANESKPNEERFLIALEEAYLQTDQLSKAQEIRKKIGKL